MKIIAIIGVIIILPAAVGIIGQAINQAHAWEEWINQDDRKGRK